MATQAEIDQMNADMDETLATMTASTTKIDGLQAFIDGLKQQITDAMQTGGVTPAVIKKVTDILAIARTNAGKIDTALTTNVTPV